MRGVKKWEIASGSRNRTEDFVLFEKASCAGIALHFYVALTQRLETVNCWSVILKTM